MNENRSVANVFTGLGTLNRKLRFLRWKVNKSYGLSYFNTTLPPYEIVVSMKKR